MLLIRELFLNLLICLPAYAILRAALALVKKRRLNVRREIVMLLFYAAAVVVLCVTGITPASRFQVQPSQHINLVPFSTIHSMRIEEGHGFRNVVGNVVLFVPFGFFTPLLWRRNGFFRTMALGALFSFMIECAQVFLVRSPDVDDLILNTCGTLAGYLVFLVFAKVFPKTVARVTTGLEGFFTPMLYVLAAAGSMVVAGMVL